MTDAAKRQRVGGIRPLERADLPAVCELYEQVSRSGGSTPPPQLLGYFEHLHDQPWADPEIPSLVYESTDGRIVGYLGSSPRRMRLDGRALRVACSENLVAHPDFRDRGVGALLVRRYLAGPQDLTLTDGGNETMRRIWVGLRGQALVHASIGWFRVFRPGATAVALLERRGSSRPLRRAVGALTPPLDDASQRLPRVRARLVPTEPDCTAEELTTTALLEQISQAPRWYRLYPDYDAAYLEWLFRELSAVQSLRGRLVRHLVRGRGGQVLGWYVYFLPYRGVAQVMQIAAPTGYAEPVFDHLLWHAASGGAAAIHGRVEPALAGVLANRRCQLRPSVWALVHSADLTVLALLGSPKSLLTRLDGEWWMGHHLLWRDG